MAVDQHSTSRRAVIGALAAAPILGATKIAGAAAAGGASIAGDLPAGRRQVGAGAHGVSPPFRAVGGASLWQDLAGFSRL